MTIAAWKILNNGAIVEQSKHGSLLIKLLRLICDALSDLEKQFYKRLQKSNGVKLPCVQNKLM